MSYLREVQLLLLILLIPVLMNRGFPWPRFIEELCYTIKQQYWAKLLMWVAKGLPNKSSATIIDENNSNIPPSHLEGVG